MAGMFYSLQEVIEKLNMAEEEVKELVKSGRLREFRDGPNLLFKVDEVNALISGTGAPAAKEAPSEEAPVSAEEVPAPAEEEQTPEEEEEILLAPEPEELTPQAEMAEGVTPVASEGINILDETDSEYKVAEDTMAETKVVPGGTALSGETVGASRAGADEASLEEIEEDVNLDTFGSGSGLLDLSLQADDTSLGGILDEIYTPEGEESKEAGPAEGSEMEVAAEVEQLMPEDEELAAPEPIVEAPAMVQAYAEPEPDTVSNALGWMLFLPLVAVVYTVVVVMAGHVTPAVLAGFIWYVMIGVAVAAGLIIGVAFMLAGGKVEKKPKVKKEKKEKVKKEKKPKKKKKAKKKEAS